MSTLTYPIEPDLDPDADRVVASSATLQSGWGAAWMLARREWVRFFRQRNRVTAAIAQPLLFWLLFGTGLRGSFTGAGQQNFLEFFLPGTIGLIVLFTAIFATISVIEDRREGFMQSVLVAPVGRWPVLFGKVMGGSAIAWVQAVFFLSLVLLFGTAPLTWSLLPLLLLLAIVAIAMCSLGLMPMWLLSGSFFPIPAYDSGGGIGPMILGTIMRVNPLSYSMAEMRHLLYPSINFASAGFAPSHLTCWLVSIAAAIFTTTLAWRLMRGSRRADIVV
jgi:ABC-2 type transport system permease protein